MHAQCVSGAGDERVGVAGVAPPIAPKPVKEVVKEVLEDLHNFRDEKNIRPSLAIASLYPIINKNL